MRLTGQIAVCPDQGRTRPYAVTPWLRGAIAPLAAAIEWERRFDGGTGVRPTALDAEAVFLLAVPLVRLSSSLSGSVRLVAQFRTKDGGTRSAGAMAKLEEGRISSCVSRLDGRADGWAAGTLSSWLHAAIRGKHDNLEFGGDDELARAMAEGIHARLFNSNEPHAQQLI
jgi:hypothetical protein